MTGRESSLIGLGASAALLVHDLIHGNIVWSVILLATTLFFLWDVCATDRNPKGENGEAG